jgi:ubiquinone biosynthesis protein
MQALDDAAHVKQRSLAQQKQLERLSEQMHSNHKGTLYAVLISAAMISSAIILQ